MAHRRDSLGLAELAARQHGVVAVAQLRALGLSKEAVGVRVRRGFLHRVQRGVYAVGHPGLTPHGLWLAAVLACGEDAMLSHGAGTVLWGLWSKMAALVEITVPTGDGRRPPPGVALHRCRPLAPADRSERDGIPVTSPARTIIDFAATKRPRQVERVIDEGHRLGLCSSSDLREAIAAHPTLAGTRLVRSVLAKHEAGTTATRSELEERFLALCADHGIPRPRVNAALLDYTVDFHWPGVV